MTRHGRPFVWCLALGRARAGWPQCGQGLDPAAPQNLPPIRADLHGGLLRSAPQPLTQIAPANVSRFTLGLGVPRPDKARQSKATPIVITASCMSHAR